ncbi:MAG: trypsin-like peptidase domain-containing protein [Pseudomonadota bacterium]|nr:trypsin-like peptidase domain-containing protein [Pseudomonadota bacterium]
MSNNGVEQIVIRHLSGSKAHQIEHISLADVNEITIGRDPKSNIAFDSSRDDIVSRRHAVIRVVRGDQISFRLADLGSNNGTFLNGERITEEVELLPEDSIELGGNGVKFIFDVQPRPANLVTRTRVIDISDAAATRVIKTAGIAARDAVSTSDMDIEPAIQKFEPPPKVGVGKETVLHLLGEERRATSRVWISSLAGLAAFVALGGGAIYWTQVHDKTAAVEEMKNAIAEREASIESKVKKNTEEEQKRAEDQRGLNAQDIVNLYGNATAQIDRAWRLYDQTTGKPVFQQKFSVPDEKSKQSLTLPAYVRLPGTMGVVRWLTLDDANRTNIPIEGKALGTGFVVGEQGFLLTNKHVAAAWKLSFGQEDPAKNDYKYGWLYNYNDVALPTDGKGIKKPQMIDLNTLEYRSLADWVPSNGGYVFPMNVAHVVGSGNVPDPTKGESHTFFGRDDVLEVRFAHSRVGATATLVRVSNDSDVALIKVDTPRQLSILEIAGDDTVTVGEKVVVLGYPEVAQAVVASNTTIENGQIRQNTGTVPIPFVSEGIVALVSPRIMTENGVTMEGVVGDIIQLSINSTGGGNSGGPVFNKAGKVIGLYTYGISLGHANTSGAVPIKYGRELLQSQYP